jgi:hypothetical protein
MTLNRRRPKTSEAGHETMNTTRLIIRATGEQPWNEISSHRLMVVLEEFLRAQMEAANVELRKFAGERQVVTGFDLDVFYLKVPKNAAAAVDAGFLREENPFEQGSAAHARWDSGTTGGTLDDDRDA